MEELIENLEQIIKDKGQHLQWGTLTQEDMNLVFAESLLYLESRLRGLASLLGASDPDKPN